MIHMHATERIFFNDRFPYSRHLFQGHWLVAGIIDSNYLLIFYYISAHLAKENAMATNGCFGLMRGYFLPDKCRRNSTLNKYVFYFLVHLSSGIWWQQGQFLTC